MPSVSAEQLGTGPEALPHAWLEAPCGDVLEATVRIAQWLREDT